MICTGKHRPFIVAALVLLNPGYAQAQDTSRWSVKMAETIMVRYPGGITNWDYVTGTILEGFEEVWRTTGDERYLDFIVKSVDAVVNENGDIDGYNVLTYNIDDVKQGCQLLTLYMQTGDKTYNLAAKNIRQQFYDHPRTSEGGFWHKKIYPWQMWLDGLYMGCPFYTEYGRLFNEPDIFNDVAHQITQMEKHARDSITGLLYHGWDESRSQAWSDPVTGQSPNFWGRGMGWYAMALVDVLDFFPENHGRRDTIIGVLQRLAKAIADFQDPVKKVWWQVLDRGGDINNYTESSGSCMFVYALAKAVRLGYIDQSYMQVVMDGYNGILKEFIEKNPDGTINLTKTCTGAGLGGNPYRDGSYEYYTQKALYRTNDGKGMGPFMMASAEIEMMDSLYPVALLMVDSVTASGVHLGWSRPPEKADSILIERISGDHIKTIGIPGADRLSFTDTSSFSPGEKYIYMIRSFHSTDTSLPSPRAVYIALNEENLPLQTTPVYPGNNQENVPVDVELSWEAGYGSTGSRVYFGTISPPPLQVELTVDYYLPGLLDYGTSYYWRIDAVNENGVTEGELFYFTTQMPGQNTSMNPCEFLGSNEYMVVTSDPVYQILQVSFFLGVENLVYLTLLDMLGHKIVDLPVSCDPHGTGNVRFGTAGLLPGLYLLIIKTGIIWKSVRIYINLMPLNLR